MTTPRQSYPTLVLWVLLLATNAAAQGSAAVRPLDLLSVGFTYRFGSINNNVVNPRFGGGGGFV